MKLLLLPVLIFLIISSLSCSRGKVHLTGEEGGIVGFEVKIPLAEPEPTEE